MFHACKSDEAYSPNTILTIRKLKLTWWPL